MESVSGTKDIAPGGEAAAARASSRPPVAHSVHATRGGPFSGKPAPDTIAGGGNAKWSTTWRKRGTEAEGTPIPISLANLAKAPASIRQYSSETERTIALIPEAVRHRLEAHMARKGEKFDPALVKPCPFTDLEIAELEMRRDTLDVTKPEEMLIYVPKLLTPTELLEIWGLKSNINFDVDRNVTTAMRKQDQWFLTQTCSAPEMIDCKATDTIHEYGFHSNGDQVVHGMDIRRYIAFLGNHRDVFGEFPDRQYWVFLWATPYDRSGIMISGLDAYGVLNSHGWMPNFRAKFVGARYAILPPREEINEATEHIERVRYRQEKNKLMKSMRKHIEEILAQRAAREAEGQTHFTPEGGEDAAEGGCDEEPRE